MDQKIVQYLNEAHATETALTRVLQSQIAMTPRGSYRSALESHLTETSDHADRVRRRLKELGAGSNPLQVAVGAAETVIGQALALTKTPIDLLRGSGGAEKVLKNAKDAAATEALEIATYTAIERLAKDLGDDKTAQLAASIRADEERMLARVLREIPALTSASSTATPIRSARPAPAKPSRPRPRRPSAPRARPARSRASRRPRARSRAPWPPRATSRSTATTSSRRARSSGGCRSSRRSTWPRSTATSAGTTTARRSSTASPRCAATSRGPDTTS